MASLATKSITILASEFLPVKLVNNNQLLNNKETLECLRECKVKHQVRLETFKPKITPDPAQASTKRASNLRVNLVSKVYLAVARYLIL